MEVGCIKGQITVNESIGRTSREPENVMSNQQDERHLERNIEIDTVKTINYGSTDDRKEK